MSDNSYIYDTYAILEIIEGNPNYEDYLDKQIIINDFIYAELCYVLIRTKYPNVSKFLDKYKKHIVHVNPISIKMAMIFRHNNKDKNLSMTDCISYFMAKDLKIKFLTGDKEFENFKEVEFIKK
ncbi:MAG: PIN domain-containing protein [archaeon]